MRATFETEVGTLSLNPVVIVGDHAMVGWVQDYRGGRAILKKNGHGLWAVFLCGGSEVRGQAAFETLGLTPTDAMQMAAHQEVEEAKLDKHTIHLMDNFGETIFFN